MDEGEREGRLLSGRSLAAEGGGRTGEQAELWRVCCSRGRCPQLLGRRPYERQCDASRRVRHAQSHTDAPFSSSPTFTVSRNEQSFHPPPCATMSDYSEGEREGIPPPTIRNQCMSPSL